LSKAEDRQDVQTNTNINPTDNQPTNKYLSLLVLPQTVENFNRKANIRQATGQSTDQQLKSSAAGNLKARVVQFLDNFSPRKAWHLTMDKRHQLQEWHPFKMRRSFL